MDPWHSHTHPRVCTARACVNACSALALAAPRTRVCSALALAAHSRLQPDGGALCRSVSAASGLAPPTCRASIPLLRQFEAIAGTLEFLWCPALGWQDAEVAKLAEALPHCRRLRVLNLAANPLGDACLPHLVGTLPSSLELLDLSRTGLTDGGALALASSLPPSSLRELNLDMTAVSTSLRVECATRLAPPELNASGATSRLAKLAERRATPEAAAANGLAAGGPPSLLPPPLPTLATSRAGGYDHLFIVALLGDVGAGKSCLLRRFAEDAWVDEGPSIGVDMCMRSFLVRQRGVTVRMQVWDEPGGDSAAPSLNSIYTGVHGVMLAYDSRSRASFQSTNKWLDACVARASTPGPLPHGPMAPRPRRSRVPSAPLPLLLRVR